MAIWQIEKSETQRSYNFTWKGGEIVSQLML